MTVLDHIPRITQALSAAPGIGYALNEEDLQQTRIG